MGYWKVSRIENPVCPFAAYERPVDNNYNNVGFDLIIYEQG
jgi:hypothetical protein